ncbi:UNVERIFIED_ORG: hypothetical protein J2740_005550 [Rhizobium nepotum]|nr:hypothetical protein [Rhizobium nepotum]WCK68531.1 HipA N-terminal domain-containing protein [Agrobacterium tumefaciens]
MDVGLRSGLGSTPHGFSGVAHHAAALRVRECREAAALAANLLPETHLAEIGQRLKVSPQDIVGLLGYIGRDTAGALSIGEPRKAGVNL